MNTRLVIDDGDDALTMVRPVVIQEVEYREPAPPVYTRPPVVIVDDTPPPPPVVIHSDVPVPTPTGIPAPVPVGETIREEITRRFQDIAGYPPSEHQYWVLYTIAQTENIDPHIRSMVASTPKPPVPAVVVPPAVVPPTIVPPAMQPGHQAPRRRLQTAQPSPTPSPRPVRVTTSRIERMVGSPALRLKVLQALIRRR